MRADLQRPGRNGLGARLADRVRRKVLGWVDGHQIVRFGDPGHRLTWEYPSWPLCKILEAHGDDGDVVTVGRYSGFHYSAVLVPGAAHHFDWVGTLHAHVENGEWVSHPDPVTSAGPIRIGSDVFIGFEAVVGSGITIGDGAVVAMRSVVVSSVEPFSIVGGNPAKHLRYRFDQPTREALLRIRWWDWPVEKVARHQHQIYSPAVDAFVQQHDPELGPPSCELCRA